MKTYFAAISSTGYRHGKRKEAMPIAMNLRVKRRFTSYARTKTAFQAITHWNGANYTIWANYRRIGLILVQSTGMLRSVK